MSKVTSEHVLFSMRLMAWERAKGELRSILQASYSGLGKDYQEIKENEEAFNAIKSDVNGFIKKMESTHFF